MRDHRSELTNNLSCHHEFCNLAHESITDRLDCVAPSPSAALLYQRCLEFPFNLLVISQNTCQKYRQHTIKVLEASARGEFGWEGRGGITPGMEGATVAKEFSGRTRTTADNVIIISFSSSYNET